MSTLPRVSSAIAGEPAHFGSVLAHQPLLAARFAEVYGAFWASDVLDARVKELCRMRNARVTACAFCRQVRFAKPLEAGLGEDSIAAVTDDYATSDKLSDGEKAALRFTDALIHDPGLSNPGAQAELKRHFSPAQIAELGVGVTLFLALAKVLITLGLEPDEMERTVLPTPKRADAAGRGIAASTVPVPRPLGAAAEHRPDLIARLQAFYATSWDEALVDPALLEEARALIVKLHENGTDADTAGSPALEFAGKLVFAHHTITDEEAAAARDSLGEAQFVAFVVAAALFDGLCRWEMVMTAGESTDLRGQPSARTGSLPVQPSAAAATLA